MGQGPVLLLLHGTGASTHSWRALAPLLAPHFTVVAPDLPGHGFTGVHARHSLTLPGMAESVADLLRTLNLRPEMGAGHSAGAAVLARMCLDGAIAPRAIVSLNGALLPLAGIAGHLFSPLARLLTGLDVVPRLFAWRAGMPGVVERIIGETGSRLEPEGIDLYRRLASNPGHVAAALGMMASWELDALARDLPRLAPRILLIAGGNDRTIAPAVSIRVRERLPGAQLEFLRGLGHLAHEELPTRVGDLMVSFARTTAVLPGR